MNKDIVLVSRTDEESVYFKLAPTDPSLDGVVVNPDGIFDVPFFGYVWKMPVAPIKSTTFHKNLWEGGTNDADWVKRFWTREEPFTDEELASLEGWNPDSEPAKPVAKPKRDGADKPGTAGTKTGRTLSTRSAERLREALRLVESALSETGINEKSGLAGLDPDDLDDLVSMLDEFLD